MAAPADQTWHKTACILCESNCGIEVRLDDRRFARIRGNKAHVSSKGYTCEKALRLDHYQNHRARLTSPMRRRADGGYEEVDWDTAIAEVAQRLAHVRDTYGGAAIFRYGGGGQGNHLGGLYGTAVTNLLGAQYRSNAIAQEKTGEAFVEARLYRAHTRSDMENTEVAVFLGKNPWQSHGFPEARRTLRAISNDPDRAMVVIDPRRTKTAELADFHLAVRPGTDAFCVAAILAIIVRDDLIDHEFLAEHVVEVEPVLEAVREVPVEDYADRCNIAVSELEAVAHRIGRASSVAIFEDLGIEQAPHSTLVSYLQRLVWILRGSFAKPGATHPPQRLRSPARQRRDGRQAQAAQGHAGDRRADHRRADPLQLHRRRGADRPSGPLPGDDHRELQPAALAGRLAPVPRGHGRPGVLGGDRRGHD